MARISGHISQKCLQLSGMGSEIRRVFQEGLDAKIANPNLDLIDLSLGNPDLEPPAEIAKSIQDILNDSNKGWHRYMDNSGFAFVREFLSKELSKSECVNVLPQQVFMTVGAAGAIQIAMRVLLDAGSEVVIFKPFFSEYAPYTAQFDAKAVYVECDENYLPQLESFEKALTTKTKLVMVNSPNNPSGVVYSKETLESIAEILRRHRKKTGNIVHILSDEPYARLIFPSTIPVPSLLQLYDAVWMVRSHSKDLGLAGERIGYLVWNEFLNVPETLAACRNAARAMGFVNAPALMQRVLPLVYGIKVDISEYEKRVNLFCEILRLGGIECPKPGAGFFVFPKVPVRFKGDDKLFCSSLLKAGVLAVPGSGFGVPGSIRCSLTQNIQRVEDAAKRIVRLIRV
jgi:aspartate aminotransferase